MEILLELLWRVWLALRTLLGDLYAPIIVNVAPSHPAERDALSPFLPLAGSLVVGILGAYVAWQVFLARTRFDEWEKTRTLKIAEQDKQIAILAGVITKVIEYAVTAEKFKSLLNLSSRTSQEGRWVYQRRFKDEFDDENAATTTRLRLLQHDLVGSGETYGPLPEALSAANPLASDDLGEGLAKWCLVVEQNVDRKGFVLEDEVSDAVGILRVCTQFEREVKSELLREAYPRSGVKARLAQALSFVVRPRATVRARVEAKRKEAAAEVDRLSEMLARQTELSKERLARLERLKAEERAEEERAAQEAERARRG